mmetsp:Transcript_66192/g.191838  ORF Transcript_66192/g.191838 Transcript_66192/m.191838 type:complete len:212 (+) Transcript_66192:704-1339(+)
MWRSARTEALPTGLMVAAPPSTTTKKPPCWRRSGGPTATGTAATATEATTPARCRAAAARSPTRAPMAGEVAAASAWRACDAAAAAAASRTPPAARRWRAVPAAFGGTAITPRCAVALTPTRTPSAPSLGASSTPAHAMSRTVRSRRATTSTRPSKACPFSCPSRHARRSTGGRRTTRRARLRCSPKWTTSPCAATGLRARVTEPTTRRTM